MSSYVLRSLIVGGLLLCAPSLARAQTIRGVVVEEGTGAPIAGVLVELVARGEGPIARAQTDGEGVFLLLPRRAGSYLLRLTHIAYAPVDSAALAATAGETVQIELRMSRTAIPVEPLVVTARRSGRLAEFYERQERGGFGRFLTREDIERRPGARATDLLRTIPGVQIVASGAGTNLITMRGGADRCLATVYIDGLPVRQFPESGIDDLLPTDAIEGVEVYTGFASAPSPIHARDGCGVVAFWSRTGEPGRRWSWKRFAVGAGLFLLLFTVTR